MLDFRPPKDSPALIRLMKLAVPIYMKWQMGGLELCLVDGARERFQLVAKKRGVVCPNHSNRYDPQIMFAFSILMQEDFNYVAARECFDWDFGLNGLWLQRLGAYSVVRGAVDRESFKMSRQIIASGKKKLVLFPEGEISRQNDTLLPLESGATQLSFWAVEELVKAAERSRQKQELEPVYITPVALRYTYAKDVRPALRNTLRSLEDRLGIKTDTSQADYPRLLVIAGNLLETLEKEYNFKATAGATMNERINALRTHILKGIAGQLHLDLPANARPLEWVRIIRNSMDDFIYSDEAPKSDYQRKIHDEKAQIVKGFYRDLDRVVNFIVIYQGYIQEHNTQERFADILGRLESEIIGGEPSSWGSRRVFLDVGDSINVTAQYAEYKKEKRNVLNTVTDVIASQISNMLLKLDTLRQPYMMDITG